MKQAKKVIRVREVMKPGVDIVDGMMSVSAVLDALKYPETRTIIVNKRHQDDEYGIVMFSDIARQIMGLNRSADRVNIYEIMSKPVLSVHPSMDVRYCVNLLHRFGLSRVPVIDNGQIVGLVSYSDIVLKGMPQKLRGMKTMSERVLISIEDGIARVRFNRPEKHNALDLEQLQAIAAAQKSLRSNRTLRVVIVEAAGEDFCSGLDIKSMMSNRSAAIRLLWKWLPWQANLAQQVSVGWRRLPLPVIAAIQGRCWGGGLQIALGADFRIAHPDASLSIMESKWGLIPDMGGTLGLRELLPRDQALRLTITAEEIDAVTARDLGLVTSVSENIEGAALQLARAICERSPTAVAATKRLYRKSWNGSQGAALARETFYQLGVLSGQNQRIAVRRQRGEDIAFRTDRR